MMSSLVHTPQWPYLYTILCLHCLDGFWWNAITP